MPVVVVESPAKAKTINKYLGGDYVVLPSYGHVRDLPSKDGSVKPDEDFAMTYQTDARSEKFLKEIARAARQDGDLILATDPDREGEAISWHVLQALQEDFGLKDLSVQRVVFNEITKRAVTEAMAQPRGLDMDLVNAQQARRALDYLVGFTLSPVLWRKLPGARSAGRVQSVALRLICDRELEVLAFRSDEYWTIEATFTLDNGNSFTARLVRLSGEKLEKLTLGNKEAADTALAAIAAQNYRISEVETRPHRRNPYPPFTTSTLQQEASRKLGLSAKQTMQIAQKLYEGFEIGGETVGLITYMRTDGVQMAAEATQACRETIESKFGKDYLPDQPREYKSKAKNAQEAHEAIRPTDPVRSPDQVEAILAKDQYRLYDLIWKRALASQMESARMQRTAIDIGSGDTKIGFRATGSVVEFPGFLKLYEEGRDEQQAGADSDDRRLPAVTKGADVRASEPTSTQHFTEPPPRYTEATLVKKLEELGIGRPSTYAAILSVLQERNYVNLEKRRFTPVDKGMLVTAFLSSYFKQYVDDGFTAEMENQLDEVSAGHVDWKQVLRSFWKDFDHAVADTAELRIRDVLDKLDALMAPMLYPEKGARRVCPTCGDGGLSLKLGKFGAFVGCSNYPDCKFTRPFTVALAEQGDEMVDDGTRVIGVDPESNSEVAIRKGPYGLYIQLGEAEKGGPKPKRATIPRDMDPAGIELDLALSLLSLPREVGGHPESGKPIQAGIGRFGPFLSYDGRYAKLTSTEEVLTIGLNRAVALMADAIEKGDARRVAGERRKVGMHPSDDKPVSVNDGRFGPYVKWGKINATIPKRFDPDTLTMEQAQELIDAKIARDAEKAGKGGKTAAGKAEKKTTAKKKAPAKKKTPAKKAGAKKTTAKKSTAKKSTAKKTAPKKAATKKAGAEPTSVGS